MGNLPITEKEISKKISRVIKSPILVSDLKALGLEQNEFLKEYAPIFEELEWDLYDVRRLQLELLLKIFPKDEVLKARFSDYYSGKKDKRSISKWIRQLSSRQLKTFNGIQPWRRRSVAGFTISQSNSRLTVRRKRVEQFTQSVNGMDIRSLPRVFKESPDHHVNTPAFKSLLKAVFCIVQSARKKIGKKVSKIGITAHFMSVQATSSKPGDNSPEGAHEDGADYIISALVVNRQNLKGGQTQIIEQLPSGKKQIIFKHILRPGQFVFQADSRDEITYGTDLWHHVTPFYLSNPKKGEGWRDIIGFDINVLK